MIVQAGADGRWPVLVSGVADLEKEVAFVAKRCVDMVLATAMLILLAPVTLTIAILIKLDSPGPVLFVQQRAGSRRRRKDEQVMWEICSFPFLKYRSMVHNADPSTHEAYIKDYVLGQVEASGSGYARFKVANDSRVTRVGRILRRTNLDELPQLVNILKGDMSLVGPRPVPLYEVEEYRVWHYQRLAALPGLTGLWQVSGRCQLSFDEQIRMDVDYVRNQSLWLDLRLLFRTVPAVLSRLGSE